MQAATPEAAAGDIHIPLHTLRGERRFWADRLLSVFKGKQIDGVEWSMKFSLTGLVGNRFLLGVQREHWGRLDFSTLPRDLAVPQSLWMRILQDMEQARAMFFAYEPDAQGGDTYRIYLEFMPAPEALRQFGVLPLGCGYKWRPADSGVAAVTGYRMRYLDSAEAFDAYLQAHLARLTRPALRDMACDVIARAAAVADPRHFMFLEVDEAETRRDSFTVTFRGADLPLRGFIPDLLRLAASLALPASEVLGFLVPDEPRSLYSLAAGTGRDGHEFLTVYYD
ncbi:hypothetical protein [Bordetella avium]|uniref:Uncharacterized protein n=1 Tax=Bordetella avium (strain 197N) TaxID=360910 RepID=Q2L0A3_BORA1|nr:hypothetical protein [Bordetella avium]AZY49283.1 hypothetical protein C0J09_09110 [Bordetella avium]AZY52640.1 hypothetical protein C0J07_09095 [Bordetella avium]RIQ12764.1 hypothetical protein D0432_11850 [Bordetella avium]RIQ37938.1 hypothetical protein D0848_09710 [Bordetella avium]RIQ41766.1 hypothetical protein D0847_10725 [Bordetella avium]